MPRQIIDVESSRPAYIRRNVTLALIVIVIVAVAAYLFVRYENANRSGNPYSTMTTRQGQPPSGQAKPPGK